MSSGVSPAHLGATLRSVLVAPRAGFESALRTSRRRTRIDGRRPEGRAPYVLAAIGGVSLALLWLKLSPLAGLRAGSALHFRWGFFAIALLAGGLLLLLAQMIWGLAGSRLVPAAGGEASARDLRLIWGASALPQVFAVFVLLPIDLLIVGPGAFTSVRLEDPVSSAWMALSVAIAVALALWSVVLFVRGVQVAAGVPATRAALVSVPAMLCVAAILVAVRFAAMGIAGAMT